MSHGMAHTPMYRCWANMVQRTTPGSAASKRGNYDGAIRDPRWDTFDGFLANPPIVSDGRLYQPGLHLARVGDQGVYSPENARWRTAEENNEELHARMRRPVEPGKPDNPAERAHKRRMRLYRRKLRQWEKNPRVYSKPREPQS